MTVCSGESMAVRGMKDKDIRGPPDCSPHSDCSSCPCSRFCTVGRQTEHLHVRQEYLARNNSLAEFVVLFLWP